MIRLILLLFCTLLCAQDKTVLLAILARDKGHCLPAYLQCIENLDYDKAAISIYINTNNNTDNTPELLEAFAKKHKEAYREITFDAHTIEDFNHPGGREWTTGMFKILGAIRNKSLAQTKKCGADYYFVVDCDNFITPCTLRTLIEKDKPIIAPMLLPIPDRNKYYSNFFSEIDSSGYFKESDMYYHLRFRRLIGTFPLPVVHCTYLIKQEYIDKLTYMDGTDDYEFAIFSRSARNNGIEQYLCNEKFFGELMYEENEIKEAALMKRLFPHL